MLGQWKGQWTRHVLRCILETELIGLCGQLLGESGAMGQEKVKDDFRRSSFA